MANSAAEADQLFKVRRLDIENGVHVYRLRFSRRINCKFLHLPGQVLRPFLDHHPPQLSNEENAARLTCVDVSACGRLVSKKTSFVGAASSTRTALYKMRLNL